MIQSRYDRIGPFAHASWGIRPQRVPKWVLVVCPTKAVYTSGGFLSAVVSGPQAPPRVEVPVGTLARMSPLDVY